MTNGFCFLLRVKLHEVPIGDKKYVILSVSEISHHQSEENMPVSSSVGSFTIVQDDVRLCFLLRGKWHEVPIGDKDNKTKNPTFKEFLWKKSTPWAE